MIERMLTATVMVGSALAMLSCGDERIDAVVPQGRGTDSQGAETDTGSAGETDTGAPGTDTGTSGETDTGTFEDTGTGAHGDTDTHTGTASDTGTGDDVDTHTSETGCDYFGEHYDVGESFPCMDGCNHCGCTEDGSIESTLIACAECKGEIVRTQGECLVDDAFCYETENGLWCTGPSAPECPDGFAPLDPGLDCGGTDTDVCFMWSEGFYCHLSRLYTIAECEAEGGEAVADPGDGSVTSKGCPDDGTAVAFIDADWDEGGLCCLPISIESDLEKARNLVLKMYPECADFIDDGNPMVKNGVVYFDCGSAVDGMAVYLDLESGGEISQCGGACMAPDREQLRVCRTLCPPPTYGDCTEAGSYTAALPQCQAIDFCGASTIGIDEIEGRFDCYDGMTSGQCEAVEGRQMYVFSNDRLYLLFSVDAAAVGHFDTADLNKSFEFLFVELKFPDQSRLLDELGPEVFNYDEVERADFWADAIVDPAFTVSLVEYVDGKLHINIVFSADEVKFETSSPDYDTCRIDDMLGVCSCYYAHPTTAVVNLELPVQGE